MAYSVTLHNPSKWTVAYKLNDQTEPRLKPGESAKWIIMGSKDNPAQFNVTFDNGNKKQVTYRLENNADFSFNDKGGGIDLFKGIIKPKGANLVPAVALIKCEFMNSTSETVYFRLNGGKGLSASLQPGKSASYNVAVDPAVPASVFIKQSNGKELNYSISDGGRYKFMIDGSKIVNAYNNN